MIRLTVNDKTLFVSIQHGLPGEEKEVHFRRVFCDETEAFAFQKILRDRLGSVVNQARGEEYNRGWKDAKSKRRKQEYFKGIL